MFKVGDKVRLTKTALEVSHRKNNKEYCGNFVVALLKWNLYYLTRSGMPNALGGFTIKELELANDFKAFINCIESSIMNNGETTT